MTERETVQLPLPTERKFAVLLFADLSGYTQLCEELDPEQVVAALHPVMASLRNAAEEQAGVICSTAGDGFFVSFGVPTAIEDAAYRAAEAADRMRSIIDSLNLVERPVRIPPVHIGIAAGEVLVHPTQEAVGFSLVGSAVNLASRLCDAAPPGSVFVDEQTYTMLRDRAQWSDPELLDVRGVGKLRAWPLARLDEPVADRAAQWRFVGRTTELGLLNRRLGGGTTGRSSQSVGVGGPPGMGERRLGAEMGRPPP